TKEAWSRLGNMARLNWKSDALATVVRPLPKGTGDPPKRHRRGNFLKSRIEKIRFGFFAFPSLIPSENTSPARTKGSRHETFKVTHRDQIGRAACRGEVYIAEAETG